MEGLYKCPLTHPQGSSQKIFNEGGGFEIKGYLWFSDHIKDICLRKGALPSFPLWLDP